MTNTKTQGDSNFVFLRNYWDYYFIFNFSSKARFLKPLEGLCESEERKYLYFGALTNLLAPINLHNPHWEYYHYTNILSTVLYSVLKASLL